MAIEPSSRLAYVANSDDGTVSGFRITPNGVLATVPLSPFLVGNDPQSVAVDVVHRFVYVANYFDGTISAFQILPNGALRAVSGSPFSVASGSASPNNLAPAVAVDPKGRFAYATSFGGPRPTVLAYRIGPDGALQLVADAPTGNEPFSVTVEPLGQFVYVASESGTVSAYRIDQTTGALTAVEGSPFQAGIFPVDVKVHPSGQFVYVVNSGDGTVSAYKLIQGTGALVEVPGSPFQAGPFASSVAINPSGSFAYVTNPNFSDPSMPSTISAYTIDYATGALTQLANSPFQVPGGNVPFSIAISP